MNFPDPAPQWTAAKAIGRALLGITVIVVILAGVTTLAGKISDPFGLNKGRLAKAESQAEGNGQQAASNAAGAAINDRRGSNLAKIDKAAQEARNAVHDAQDHDAALRGYLDGLDRLRIAGAAPVTDAAADGGRSDPDPGS